MNFEGLTPEQQAKVEACKTPEELLELAKSEGVEIPDEQLENIAGGWGGKRRTCPQCGSTDVSTVGVKEAAALHCNSCDHTWI